MTQTVLPDSRSLAARALRRISKFPLRKDLTAVDPLMAEIALAQLDATLALVQELRAQGNLAITTQHEARYAARRAIYAPNSYAASVVSVEAFRKAQADIAWLKEEVQFFRNYGRTSDTPAPEPEPLAESAIERLWNVVRSLWRT